MAGFFSVGDVLMLSQVAWKIGCAFTSGRQGAPAQFQELENELNSLTYALTQLAEALDEDDSIISRVDQKTKEGAEKILKSCEQTLANLNNFVNQYQELKEQNGSGGGRIPTQKSWKRILLRNYKTIWWTAEGGNIDDLRSMLNVHVSSISLMMQALQSKSLSRLENTIEPMANKVDNIHTALNGDLNVKIDEIHHLMLSMAAMENSPGPSDRISTMMRGATNPDHNLAMQGAARRKSSYSTEQLATSYKLPDGSDGLQVNTQGSGKRMSWAPSPLETSITGEVLPEYQKYRSPLNTRNSIGAGSQLGSRPESEISRQPSESSVVVLPEHVVEDLQPDIPFPASKKSIEVSSLSELCPALQMNAVTTDSEQAMFERTLFSDSAVLCEARCTQIEYTVPDEDNPMELQMIQGSEDCRLFLVTKRHRLSSGMLRFTTSIWALSDDRKVRMQQELPDGVEVVPYTVWGNLRKICIRVPTELKFYDVQYDAKPLDTAQTSWVNYVLEDDIYSSSFQSALMGKTLVMTVQTNKTMRIHDGIIADTFSYAEQMCALENMRIWQDHETNGVMAMIHYTAHFRDGYMAFYLNSSRDPIRIRDDGPKTVKIKGLHLEVSAKAQKSRTGSIDARRSPTMKTRDAKMAQIKGAKIEFTTVEDKIQFINKVREVQGQFFSG